MLSRLRLSLHQLGPGLITGAADDAPSRIATYSRAGAQFGFSMLWSMVFTLPLMAAIQVISARIKIVLAGSLQLRLERGEGRGFYGVVAAATLGGVALCFTAMDPVKELFWSAVFNGVTAVPIMTAMMVLASRPSAMQGHAIGRRLRVMGWLATAVMALTVLELALA